MIVSAFRSLNMTSKTMALILGPLLLLAIRLWLAQIFLLAAAVQFAAPGQPAPSNIYACFELWLHAGSPAQMLAVWVAVLFALLLAGGMATRVSALLLAGVSLAAFLFDVGQEQNILWALLLLLVAVFGAGPISLDAVFGRITSRNTGLGTMKAAASRHSLWLGQGLLTGLRFWLVWVLLASALTPSGVGTTPVVLAPLSMVFGYYGEVIHLALAGLAMLFLAPGFLTRPAAGLAAVILLITALNTGREETLYIAALLGFLARSGPGFLALDGLLKLDKWPSASIGKNQKVPHIVVIGAGFGGLAAVNRLMRQKCRITLIDRRNHHLFQPLLYQVATAALSPGEIALPIRGLFRGQDNVQVLMGEVIGVDREAFEVKLGDRRIAYDHLIVASGARSCYFGKDSWEKYAPGLKQIEDATYMRSRLLAAFEHAEDAQNVDARQAWLNFVIIGGGPTGVEMAGALAELAHHGLNGEFRTIDPAKARIILLDRGARCLTAFPAACSARAITMLEALGVELRFGANITNIDDTGVTLEDGSRILARTVLWTAGVQASPAAKWLALAPGPGGRVPVTSRLSLEGDDRVFVIGDTAAMPLAGGGLVPGLAPAAKQAGVYAARVISANMRGKREPSPFRYKHQGSLATIGRSSAIADFGWIRLSGAPAWWLWGAVHVGFLTGMRNRIAVALQWFWAYITYHRSTRLITGAGGQLTPHSAIPASDPDM